MGSGGTIVEELLAELGGAAVIDRGMATELERHGADLNDPLWSSKCLLSSPDLIRQVHLDYLEAGADIIVTSSYQLATIQGFVSKGLSKKEGEALLRRSVEIACEARDIFLQKFFVPSFGDDDGKVHKRRAKLVAASVGSYGAYLADGSEYSGIYGESATLQFLKTFHKRRVQVLSESGRFDCF